MNNQRIINKTAKFVKQIFEDECSGHDWWHIYRVWQNAKKIAKKEGANLLIVELTALLHDIADIKFGSEKYGIEKIKRWLIGQKVPKKQINDIVTVIKETSYKGAKTKTSTSSVESAIVQDADRLEAIGAVGIARVFAYGGKIKRPLHNPNIKPIMHKNFREYVKHGNTSSINHFYEKLLLVKDKMNTKTGKKMAISRHKFIKQYLDRFFKEWKGEI